MAAIDEIVSYEEDVKKLRSVILEHGSNVRRLKGKITDAEKRLVSVKGNVVFCEAAMAKFHEPHAVVPLYSEGGEPGEWLKTRKLLNDNRDIVQRIKVEIAKNTSQLNKEQQAIEAAQLSIKALEGKLSKYGQIVRFER